MTKNTRLSKTYWKYVKRMGKKKATVALANLILRIAYHLLKAKSKYCEMENEYEKAADERREQKLVKLLETKGYRVSKIV